MSRVSIGRWLRVGRASLLALFVPSAIAQLSINDSGTASYTYPIAVPPGIAGMVPTLALSYGGGGNGPVGFGWSIQGLSTITRCPQTRGVDGNPRGVNFDAEDKLCLDGQRLIQTDADGTPTAAQTSDSAGGSGMVREYRTEKDSYARIRAYESAAGDPVNGPAYFKVWTKSGQIYEYGAGPSSNEESHALVAAQGKTVAMVWAASRVSDTLGNYIDFKYIQRDTAWGTGPAEGARPGREWNLAEIQYTGTASQPPANKIVFDYSDRPDNPGLAQSRAEAYQAGSKNVSISRLDAVRTYVNWSGPDLGVTAQSMGYPAAPMSPTSAGAVLAPPPHAVKVKTVSLTYVTAPNTGRMLVGSIKDCAGAGEARCSPPTTFQYTPGGNQAYQANPVFASDVLSTRVRLMDVGGNYGALLGDFNGDGKTDILRWANNFIENQLWLSSGKGNFNEVPLGSGPNQFNLSDQRLFSADGCYSSIVADFNADGIADILQVANCGAKVSQLFIGNGDGNFKSPIELAGMDLSTVTEKVTAYPFPCAPNMPICMSKSEGRGYFVIDVDGDGILDIITTISPGYSNLPPNYRPSAEQMCNDRTCTTLYRGSLSNGVLKYTEQVDFNLTHHSVYSDPPVPGLYSALVTPATLDVDGDGLTDLSLKTGVWRSTGDGNFTLLTTEGGAPACNNPVDANGDGRIDCLNPAVREGETSTLSITTGAPPALPFQTTNFNLTGAGDVLYAQNGSYQQSIGTLTGDFVGDGRSGILRWEDTAANNVLYLSNGDGTFRRSESFNLQTQSLQSTDRGTLYLAGDFSGRGTLDILRMKQNLVPGDEGATNQIYERVDNSPPDLLSSVTSPSGLVTTLTWVPLTDPYAPDPDHQLDTYQRYTSDRELGARLPAPYPQVDVTPPMFVVATVRSDTGVGAAQVATEYGYVGLKADIARGMLGFRQISRETLSPTGERMTQVTDYLQVHPYIGATASSRTFNVGIRDSSSAITSLSSSSYIYCDKSAGAGVETEASPQAPCAVASKIQKPYLYKSIESGQDLAGAPLPTVTTVNTFDGWGNPTGIAVTTTGSAAGQSQEFTRITTNAYKDPPDTDADNWVLGRLLSATQRNIVPNALPSIGTSPGDAPNASATEGSGEAPAVSLPAAVLPIIQQPLLDD